MNDSEDEMGSDMFGGGSGTPGDDLKVPQDICEWVSPHELVSWLQEELKAMSSLEPLGSVTSVVLTDSMLALLAFSYARGIYDHEEIAELCQTDQVLRSLSREGVSSSELVSFRYKHRELLVKVIVQLLIKATRQKFNLTGPALAPGLRKRLQNDAVDRLDNARHIDRGEEA